MKCINFRKYCVIKIEKQKGGVLTNFARFTAKHLCWSPFCNEKETLNQVFFCEFCEIFKNTYFIEHLGIATSKKEGNKFYFLLSSLQSKAKNTFFCPTEVIGSKFTKIVDINKKIITSLVQVNKFAIR